MSEELEQLLRKHDPAANAMLTSFDRTRILQSARHRHHVGRPRLLAALAFVLLVLAVLELRPHRDRSIRQIQYATPGGTRIVWTLDPNFHM